MLYVLSYSSIPNAYPSLTLDHQTVLAQHTVHPILVSCGPGGEILFGDLSSPTGGHTYTNFPKFSIIVHSRRRHSSPASPAARLAPVLSALAPQIPVCATLSQAHDSTTYLSVYIPPARPPARLHVKRPHDPFLGVRATRRPCVGLSPARRSALDCGPLRRHAWVRLSNGGCWYGGGSGLMANA
jgi:hypothetical protein